MRMFSMLISPFARVSCMCSVATSVPGIPGGLASALAGELKTRMWGRPLLGATWPELVRARLGAAGDLALGGPAAAAAAALARTEYAALPGRERLALLEALVHAAADVDAVRRCP